MKLTTLEKDILNHRLEVPDSIYEAIVNPHKGDDFEDHVYEICEVLLAGNYDEAITLDRNLTTEILLDCIDGSTYWAVCNDRPCSAQKMSAVERAAFKLIQKIRELTEWNGSIAFPLY